MARVAIRDLDDSLQSSLGIKAAIHGCSLPDEVRDILCCSRNE